jgi:hypothetical protein
VTILRRGASTVARQRCRNFPNNHVPSDPTRYFVEGCGGARQLSSTARSITAFDLSNYFAGNFYAALYMGPNSARRHGQA